MIGIDLGTTNSAVAIMEGKAPKIIENSEGQSTSQNEISSTDAQTHHRNWSSGS